MALAAVCSVLPENASSKESLLLLGCGILLYLKFVDWNVFHSLKLLLEYLFMPIPKISVQLTKAESSDDGVDTKSPSEKTEISLKDPTVPGMIQCFDPSTLQKLGEVKAMTEKEVNEACAKAKKAQKEWAKTSFAERRKVLRTMQKYIVDHVEDICRVCARDSGKSKVDALLGEVMTTCEKVR